MISDPSHEGERHVAGGTGLLVPRRDREVAEVPSWCLCVELSVSPIARQTDFGQGLQRTTRKKGQGAITDPAGSHAAPPSSACHSLGVWNSSGLSYCVSDVLKQKQRIRERVSKGDRNK